MARGGVRPLVVPIPVEDLERLRILANRRELNGPEDLAALLIVTWLDGPGRGELLQAIMRPNESRTSIAKKAAARSRNRGIAGQLALVDDDTPPF
jgi:hypothetical protein